MSTGNAVVRSRYFGARPVDIAEDAIVVVSTMRNEALRLPYFLEHYRALGVDRFLMIDNGSTDGTAELLRGQPDVEYFHTEASYRGSSSGRLWSQEIADRYATGHWVLTLDVDELLVFPGSEALGLRELTDFLDAERSDGLFTVMVDMYSDRPLCDTRYLPGEPFLDTCAFFETETYELVRHAHPPFLGVVGGPRGRLLAGTEAADPMQMKVPLIRWRSGFSYAWSTHNHRYVRLSDVTGALLHFKFFAGLDELVEAEAARRDRRQAKLFDSYAERIDADLCLFGPQSRRFTAPSELVRHGVVAVPDGYREFVRRPDLLPECERSAGGRLDLTSVSAVWPFVNNPGVAKHFGADRVVTEGGSYAEAMARYVGVVDVAHDHILLRIGEPVLHRWRHCELALAAYVDGRLVGQVTIGGSGAELEADVGSLEPGIHIWHVSVVANGARRPVGVRVVLRDVRAGAELGGAADADIHDQSFHPRPVDAERGAGLDGVVAKVRDGELLGWVYDEKEDTFDVPLAVRINGRLAAAARPDQRARGLPELIGVTTLSPGLRFRIPLPLGYFAALGNEQTTIEVTAAGRNIRLRRTPVCLSATTGEARWRAADGWVASLES